MRSLYVFSFVCAALTFSPAIADEREAQLTAVRQISAAGAYKGYCSSLRFGPGLDAIASKNHIKPKDMAEGGRFFDVALRHAIDMKTIIRLLEQESPGATCVRAMEHFGPRGRIAPNVLVER